MHYNIYHHELTTKNAISNYIYYLKKILEEEGHKVTLVCVTNNSGLKNVVKGRKAGLEIIKTRLRKTINWFLYGGYYELIHLIKYVAGKKIFDYQGVTPPELWKYQQGMELVKKGEAYRDYARHADLIIAHSKSAYDELGEITENKKHILLRKYQLGKFKKKEVNKEKYQKIGLKKKDKVILYVGRISYNKRVPVLIKALKHVKTKNKKLVIIGKYDCEPYTTEYHECLSIAEKEGVLNKVLFLGQVSDEVLNDFYNLADVFAIPSLHEGFCIPVIESMKVGTPVIGANAAALPETIGTAGLLFKPEDHKELAEKIDKVLKNNKLRKELIKKGFKHYPKKQLKKADVKRVIRRLR